MSYAGPENSWLFCLATFSVIRFGIFSLSSQDEAIADDNTDNRQAAIVWFVT